MKSFRPTSPSNRQRTVESFGDLSKKKAPKSLLAPLPDTGGRNNHGHMTTRHKGGGHKRLYRIIDFRRKHEGIPAVVEGIYYDPNRSARIALLNYANGYRAFIVAPVGIKKGDKIETGPQSDIRPGNALPIQNIPVGTTLHAIELKPGCGAQLVRSAGASAMLLGKEGKDAQIRLPSGEVRLVSQACYATIGQVGNLEHESVVVGKAGRSRWLGIRPSNRGTSMNPVDHPMVVVKVGLKVDDIPSVLGGQPTKGYKTRNNKRTDGRIVRGRPRGKMTRG